MSPPAVRAFAEPPIRSTRMSPPDVSSVAEPATGPTRTSPASVCARRSPLIGPSRMSPPKVLISAPLPAEAIVTSPACVRIFTRPLTLPTR